MFLSGTFGASRVLIGDGEERDGTCVFAPDHWASRKKLACEFVFLILEQQNNKTGLP